MSDVDTLVRAAWAYAAAGAETPTVAMKPGGNGPALLWSNGAYMYLDAFGTPVESGEPPRDPNVPPSKTNKAGAVVSSGVIVPA